MDTPPQEISPVMPTTTVQNLTVEDVRLALTKVAVGPQGKSVEVCAGYTLTLFWERTAHYLSLQPPSGKGWHWSVGPTSLGTKGPRKRWAASETFYLTPSACADVAPRLLGLIQRSVAAKEETLRIIVGAELR